MTLNVENFIDVGTLDRHKVVVNWDDGTTSDSTANPEHFTSFQDSTGGVIGFFAVTHRFTTGGIFAITVTVFDDDTGVSNVVTINAYVVGVRVHPLTHQLQIVGTNVHDKIKLTLGSDGSSDGHSDGHSDGSSDGGSDGGSDHRVVKLSAKIGCYSDGSDGSCEGGGDGGSDGHSDGGSDGHSDGGSDGHSDGGSDGGRDYRELGGEFSFNLDDISNVVMILCDGDDTAEVSSGLTLPVLIEGGAGSDYLVASNGNSTLLGESGDDTLIGRAGNDTIDGGDGDDCITAGGGVDTIIGGAGRDSLKEQLDANMTVTDS